MWSAAGPAGSWSSSFFFIKFWLLRGQRLCPFLSVCLCTSLHPLPISNPSSINTYLLMVSTHLPLLAFYLLTVTYFSPHHLPNLPHVASPSLLLSLLPLICPALPPSPPASLPLFFNCPPPPLHHFLLLPFSPFTSSIAHCLLSCFLLSLDSTHSSLLCFLFICPSLASVLNTNSSQFFSPWTFLSFFSCLFHLNQLPAPTCHHLISGLTSNLNVSFHFSLLLLHLFLCPILLKAFLFISHWPFTSSRLQISLYPQRVFSPSSVQFAVLSLFFVFFSTLFVYFVIYQQSDWAAVISVPAWLLFNQQ